MILFFCLITHVSVSAPNVTGFCPNDSHELMDALQFTVNSDDFANASPENPMFLRLKLPSGVVLGNSVGSVDPSFPNAVHLALRLRASSQRELDLAEDAISIVRWRRGERAIWFKVIVPSSLWLRDGDTHLPPQADDPVSFTIGVDAPSSASGNSHLIEQHLSNARFNRYADNFPADTRLFLDFSHSEFADIESDETLGLLMLEAPEILSNVIGVNSEADENEISFDLVDQHTNEVIYNVAHQRGCLRQVFPWVSNNQQYQSQLWLSNGWDRDGMVRLQATSGNGSSAQVEIELAAKQMISLDLDQLFDLTPSFSLLVYASSDLIQSQLHVTLQSYGLAAVDGIRVPPLSFDGGAFGLTFNVLPNQDAVSAITLVNISDEIAQLTVRAFSRDGSLLHQSNLELEPRIPYARLTDTFAPNQDVRIEVGSFDEIVGASFLFNAKGYPSIVPAIQSD